MKKYMKFKKLRRTHTEKYCKTLLEYKHKASKGGDGVKKYMKFKNSVLIVREVNLKRRYTIDAEERTIKEVKI